MSRFKGIYWRTFTVTVGMVALTLVLLGASFFALTYSYIMSEAVRAGTTTTNRGSS